LWGCRGLRAGDFGMGGKGVCNEMLKLSSFEEI